MLNQQGIRAFAFSMTAPGRCSAGSSLARSQASVWVLTERQAEFTDAISAMREQLFEVRVVTDGWQAYDEALISPPSVVVIDGGLKKMDATAFCNLIRGVDWLARTPLIYIDDERLSDARLRAFSSGASDCISYPFLAEELLARLRLQFRALRQTCERTPCTKRETEVTTERGTQCAISLIKGSGLGQWTARSLANRIGLSDRRLADQFKASVGMSATDYLRMERIERAAWLLTHSGIAVSEVAKKAGFRSPCNFSVAFKRHMGMSPTEFRNGVSFAHARRELEYDGSAGDAN